MQLKAHGNVNLTWNKNLLVVEVLGPFNLEGVNHCFKKIQESVLANKPAAWARIDILDQETLGSPEVMRVIGATYKWCLEQGCSGVGSVCTTYLQAEILEKTRVSTGMNLAGFNTLSDAKAWCREQLNETILAAKKS